MSLDPAVTHKTAEARGTMIFMPPEAFDSAAVSFAHDIYSFGIIRERPRRPACPSSSHRVPAAARFMPRLQSTAVPRI
jgi:serine/threonine protein kinase